MLDGSFAVSRRTWIDTDGSRWTKRPWSVGLEADNISLLIGTSVLLWIDWTLLTEQLSDIWSLADPGMSGPGH